MKRRAEKKWLKSGNPDDYAFFRDLKIKHRNDCDSVKSTFFTSTFAACGGDQKQLLTLSNRCVEDPLVSLLWEKLLIAKLPVILISISWTNKIDGINRIFVKNKQAL